MSDKTYLRVLIALLAFCFVFTALHLGYIVYAYNNSSIIYYISQEFWP